MPSPEHPVIPGFTSTASKRPEALFGGHALPGQEAVQWPVRMVRSSGCQVWDERGREYLDFIMALGAVALGYGHPAVNQAAQEAIAAGVVGPLPPVLEEEVARELLRLLPFAEGVRFFKTGAEAMAAAVRLARVVTGRDLVLGCGYHGWLDWCQRTAGVPEGTQALFGEIPFNDADRTKQVIRAAGDELAAVTIEPLVVVEPEETWLQVIREEVRRAGAVLILDEIKTFGRLGLGGAAERYRVRPDLTVLGKALANGFPLAAVAGRREIVEAVTRTWISSTLATEFVALAAARATLRVMETEKVPAHLRLVGGRLLDGLRGIHQRFPNLVTGVAGVPEMCFLQYASEDISRAVAMGCARAGVLFKRTAYNFVSLAHDGASVDRALAVLDETLSQLGRVPRPTR